MNKEFKQTFLTSLLVVLLVISNLIGAKLTTFLGITIATSFITFPFTFLCTLLILNDFGKETAYRGILVSCLIQLIMTICYTLAVNMSGQTLMPDMEIYVNALFKVNELNILGSILSFGLSHCLLIYVYDNFKRYGKELYGIVIGLLGAMFLNTIIYIPISLQGYAFISIINMILSNIIVSIIMVVIITICYFIFREREIVKKDYEKIKKVNCESKDLSLEEVILQNNIKKTQNTKKRNYSRKNTPKKNTSTNKSTTKKRNNNSKPKVKKDDK